MRRSGVTNVSDNYSTAISPETGEDEYEDEY